VYLDIATTASVKNSGLLDALLPGLIAEKGITMRVHAPGSGRALEMLADGVVDLVITHAPRRENEYLAEHPDWIYRKIAFNRFVIVGPPYDPAKIHQARSAVEAFSRIAAADVNFISRNDGSGTHERELQLWEAAGSRPGEGRLIVSGGSMAVALRHADERVAYTLSDEATFRQFQAQLEVRVLFANHEQLLNTYALVYAPGVPQAVMFAEWLSDGAGRRRLETYTVAGATAFFVWPQNCPAARPDARPCVP
jgi:tungstate transport system substrate-binding protein